MSHGEGADGPMVLLRLDSVALSRSRFALSPLAETLGSMIVLSRPGTDPWLSAWHGRHQAVFRARLNADPFAKGLVRLIGSTKYLPDHLTLPPMGGMGTTLESELAGVVLIPDETVRHGLEQAVAHSWKDHDLTWLSGRDWSTRTAELFHDVWRDHLAADWPRRRALLERDVTYRAGLLAAYGWPRALQQMSRRSAWVGTDAIRFSDRPGPDRIVGADGMLFVPVTKQRGSWLCKGPTGPHALVYPARGAGEMASRGRTARALARLLGPGRATILRELEHPATSTELAAQLDQSLGTIGGHLAVLREAELVVGTRVGRRVVYRRTELGDQLAGGVNGATQAAITLSKDRHASRSQN
ncbi:ArsR/SmtB family transcription factor [Streptomyces rhizosphaericus]|uniref:ArsR/SmtB family transcription factor n=2 Tax=Streptomyces TaxID=1883 RepID=UPI001FCA2BB6|nr:winged helix-turn-helix domain-containing protein [Streptomyces rhizosphaericus]